MMLFAWVLLCLVAIWLLGAFYLRARLGIALAQAALYLPLKLIWRVRDGQMQAAGQVEAPVIYAIWHQSRLDPALMLSLLPEDTLHILDDEAARSHWLEPWRSLARTIAFNAEHVFVSRRLVRVLKRKGRLAVYFPDTIEPDTKSFRLFRAVARIAVQADAKIVPIFVSGGRYLPLSLTPASAAPRSPFGRLSVAALPPLTIAGLVERAGGPAMTTVANALFDYMAEVRVAGVDLNRTLFQAARDAADRFGPGREVVQDAQTDPLSYRRLFIAARVIGARLQALSRPGEAVGVMLPNSNAVVVSLLALQSAARVPAMINYTAGQAAIAAAIRTAAIRSVVSSHAFVEKANLGELVAAIEAAGARMVWLEEERADVTSLDRIAAALLWRLPLERQEPAKPALILFTSGSEGTPKGVVLSHRNLLANVMQVEARIAFSPSDTLLNVLPVFHSFGLTGGLILPLLTGVRLFLYPSPLHYKIIPGLARKIRPTVMFGTDTFLAAYARTAGDDDFSSLRFAVAGAEAVRAETRAEWRDRFDALIVEGFGMTEAAPVVAVNTAAHGRHGSVGRLLPGMRMRLEPVEGLSEGSRLWIAGPNVMMGYMTAEKPGVLQPLAGEWHDTGDIVTIDREGFITIRGRAKRFAKIAGEMVSLGALEVLVNSLWPENRHAAVSVPDKRRGERIVLVTTAGEADAETLRVAGRKAGLPEIMIPGDVVKVAEIPVLGSGKTDHIGARRLAMESLGIAA